MACHMDLYDSIGRGYAAFRRPDHRIASAIDAALGDAVNVVNIGAGAGSYEPPGRKVLAVEPSEVMIRPPEGRVAASDAVVEIHVARHSSRIHANAHLCDCS